MFITTHCHCKGKKMQLNEICMLVITVKPYFNQLYNIFVNTTSIMIKCIKIITYPAMHFRVGSEREGIDSSGLELTKHVMYKYQRKNNTKQMCSFTSVKLLCMTVGSHECHGVSKQVCPTACLGYQQRNINILMNLPRTGWLRAQMASNTKLIDAKWCIYESVN